MKSQKAAPAHPPWAERDSAPAERSSHQYLLDFEVELCEELDARARLLARSAITAVVFEADPGEVRLSDWLAMAGSGPGVLVLEGVVATGVHVGDRIAAELVGAGDLLQPWRGEDEELLACAVDWRALVPARFALLDAAVAERMGRWPQLGLALLRRVGRRTRRLNVQRAIAAQPRLEVRLALLLWHLAGRWGKVAPGGVRLPVPLTHQMLGRLIAAERPSVSHALARLSESGLVTAHGDEWHLHGSLEQQLAAMFDAVPTQVEWLDAASGSVGAA